MDMGGPLLTYLVATFWTETQRISSMSGHLADYGLRHRLHRDTSTETCNVLDRLTCFVEQPKDVFKQNRVVGRRC